MPNKKTTVTYIVLWDDRPATLGKDDCLSDSDDGIAESFTRPQAARAIKRTVKASDGYASEADFLIIRVVG